MSAGEPAGRRPRLDDVAAAAGVSPATVSLVLRGVAGPSVTTRERVLEAAAQLGYRPDRAASLLASRRSRLIGASSKGNRKGNYCSSIVPQARSPRSAAGGGLPSGEGSSRGCHRSTSRSMARRAAR